MLRRERDLCPRPHPTVRDLTAAVGAPLYVCTATGAAEVTAPADTAHCRGGFFCDEPVRRRSQLRLENSRSTASAQLLWVFGSWHDPTTPPHPCQRKLWGERFPRWVVAHMLGSPAWASIHSVTAHERDQRTGSLLPAGPGQDDHGAGPDPEDARPGARAAGCGGLPPPRRLRPRGRLLHWCATPAQRCRVVCICNAMLKRTPAGYP